MGRLQSALSYLVVQLAWTTIWARVNGLTVVASHHAVNAQTRAVLLDLARFDGRECLNGTQTRVLSQG